MPDLLEEEPSSDEDDDEGGYPFSDTFRGGQHQPAASMRPGQISWRRDAEAQPSQMRQAPDRHLHLNGSSNTTLSKANRGQSGLTRGFLDHAASPARASSASEADSNSSTGTPSIHSLEQIPESPWWPPELLRRVCVWCAPLLLGYSRCCTVPRACVCRTQPHC